MFTNEYYIKIDLDQWGALQVNLTLFFRDFQFAKEKYRGERKGRNKFIILLALGAMFGATGFHFLHIS